MRWLAAAVIALACARVAAQPAPAISPAVTAWKRSVDRALDATWHPRQIFDDHLQGRDQGPFITALRVTIAADGELRDVVVARSSGLPAFDDEALHSFRAVPRFEPPPAELVHATTGAVTLPWSMWFTGWRPPYYLGDAGMSTLETSSVLVGSSMDLNRLTANDAYYQRTTLTAEAAFRLPNGSLLELRVPYVFVQFHDPSNAAVRDLSGFGDLEVHAHARFNFRRSVLVLSSGVSLPTGHDEAMPVIGATSPAVVQLGSGTVELMLGLCSQSFVRQGLALGGCASLRSSPSSNSHGYQDPLIFRDRAFFAADLFGRQVSEQGGLFLEVNGHATLNDQHVPETSGLTLYAEDSIWVIVFRGLTARATIAVPVVTGVERMQQGVQLRESVRAMIGLSWDFGRR